MSSPFTYSYSQPQEYHFSLDSVELAQRVARLEAGFDFSSAVVMDLCAGCGVVGFDFHHYHQQIAELIFLEIQRTEYEKHFIANLQKVRQLTRAKTRFESHWENYDVLQTPVWSDRMDLILCNPPYFVPDQGRLSPSAFKNRCRFFMDSSFDSLILGILNALKSRGVSYILLRPLVEHGLNLGQDLVNLVGDRAKSQVIDVVRGTELIRLQKS